LKNVGTDPGIAAAFEKVAGPLAIPGSVPIFFNPYGVKNLGTGYRIRYRWIEFSTNGKEVKMFEECGD
jgi:hypothetical protein